MKNEKNNIPHDLPQAGVIQAAIDCGIDVQMLIDNLRRTPTERVRRHQIALDTVKMLQKASPCE